jgi:hypothetical protein
LADEYIEIRGFDYKEHTGRNFYKGTYVEDSKLYNMPKVEARNIVGERVKYMKPFPFSYSPPLDVFGRANTYAKDNMKEWIGKSIDLSKD